jgi:GR25 family glycosyltransferase involved in LPS biosynthesis
MTKHMDGIDVIYWINLDRSIDRRVEMETLLDNPSFNGIPNIRISAVDGVKDKYDMLCKYANTGQKSVSDTEYACLLSHLETIREFSNSVYDIALILEDDVTLDFQKYWSKTVRVIMDSAPRDWEIIQLCYILNHNYEIPVTDFDHSHYSTAAYLIKRDSAARLMDEIYTNHKYHVEPNIVHNADIYLYKKLKTYTYKYPMFIYKKENYSTIHNEHLSYHERSRNMIEKHVYGVLDSDYFIRYILGFMFILFVCIIILYISPQFYTKIYHFTITKMN